MGVLGVPLDFCLSSDPAPCDGLWLCCGVGSARQRQPGLWTLVSAFLVVPVRSGFCSLAFCQLFSPKLLLTILFFPLRFICVLEKSTFLKLDLKIPCPSN